MSDLLYFFIVYFLFNAYLVMQFDQDMPSVWIHLSCFLPILKGVNFHYLVPTEKKGLSCSLTLSYSERPQLYGVFAVVSAIGLKKSFNS